MLKFKAVTKKMCLYMWYSVKEWQNYVMIAVFQAIRCKPRNAHDMSLATDLIYRFF